jgi:hypothetical protein
VSFSISNIRQIEIGGLVATFEVSMTAGDFADAVTFDALLCSGPYGYFVNPASVRDQTGKWRTPLWFSRPFAKALCALVMEALELKEPQRPGD